MACNCGKNRRLPKMTQPALSGSATAGHATTHVFFYAIPPEGNLAEPSRFETLREARWFAQRQPGAGWMIEGRREPIEHQFDSRSLGATVALGDD